MPYPQQPAIILHLHRTKQRTGLRPAEVATLCMVASYEATHDGLPVPRKDLIRFGENVSKVDPLFPLHELMGHYLERRETAFGAGYATTPEGRMKIAEMREQPAAGAAE